MRMRWKASLGTGRCPGAHVVDLSLHRTIAGSHVVSEPSSATAQWGPTLLPRGEEGRGRRHSAGARAGGQEPEAPAPCVAGHASEAPALQTMRFFLIREYGPAFRQKSGCGFLGVGVLGELGCQVLL